MFVTVDRAPGGAGVALREPTRLDELKVVIGSAVTPAEAEAALRRIGRVRDDQAWIRIAELERLARAELDGRSDVAAWKDGFDRMLSYAATRGWVNETDHTVAAHCETDGRPVSWARSAGDPRA